MASDYRLSHDMHDGDREIIEDCFNEAIAMEAEGQNPYPGSNYVAGVKAALAWVLGESDDAPLEW